MSGLEHNHVLELSSAVIEMINFRFIKNNLYTNLLIDLAIHESGIEFYSFVLILVFIDNVIPYSLLGFAPIFLNFSF